MVRDSELYKDKIEVSLDGRQIFYLFFGGAVIVGLVFVLGVMVGRRVEARGHVGRARTASAVDPLAALDRLEGGNGLSFQGALSGQAPAATAVERQIDALAQARAADGARTGVQARSPLPHAAEAGHAAKPDHAKPEPDHAQKAAAADDDAAAEVDDGAPAAHAHAEKKDAKKAEKKSESKSADKKGEKKTDKTTEKKSEPSPEAKADKKPEKKSDKKSKRRYTLQVSSFQDRAEADALLAALRSSGYQPSITTAEVDGKTFYRVRLGTYHSADAANDAKAEFERTTKQSASVMRL